MEDFLESYDLDEQLPSEIMSLDEDYPKAGKDVDAYCSSCKLDLAHTIVAMVDDEIVKVKCNTCHREHKYRPPRSSKPPASHTRPRKPAPRRKKDPTAVVATINDADMWKRRLAEMDASNPRDYTRAEYYEVGDVITHPKFGLGIVEKARQDRKMLVLFEGGFKLLIYNRP